MKPNYRRMILVALLWWIMRFCFTWEGPEQHMIGMLAMLPIFLLGSGVVRWD